MSLVSGSGIMMLGLIFVLMYIIEAIVKRIGEADQSLIFWYIPILFIGIIGFFAGLLIFLWGLRNLQRFNVSKKSLISRWR